MIRDFIIRDSKNLPRRYASNMEVFSDGAEFHFKPGVNIIIGRNGSGKTTLVEMIKSYLWIDLEECGNGMYNSTAMKLLDPNIEGEWLLHDGADLKADYRLNSFCLVNAEDYTDSILMQTGEGIANRVSLNSISDGERTNRELEILFNKMFSKKTNLLFDYKRVADRFPNYGEYIKRNTVEGDEFTVFMDEPDSSLDIENVKVLYDILSFHKEHTQLIVIIHNPFLIEMLSNVKSVNFIEMTEGYKDYVCETIKKLRKK